MAQMWKQLVVVMTVAVTISWAGPLEHSKQHAPHPPVSHLLSKTRLPVNILEKSQPVSEIIAPSAETTQVNLPINAELVSEINPPSAETTQVKLPINAELVREIHSKPIIQNIKAPSNIQTGPAFIRNNDIQPCTHEGIFGIVNNCSFFLICQDKSTREQYSQLLYKCYPNFYFNEIEGDCVNNECPSFVFNDPGMPAPPPQFQTPEWLNTLPSWFNSTPWWFKTPPAWFHTAPAWFNAPPKSQILEEIKTEGEGVYPETITKEVTFGGNTSINGRGNAYYDNKTLNIHIPIKIIQN